MRFFPGLVAVMVMGGGAAMADSIVLKNGDKITGKIEEVNPSSVIVATPYAGRLVIERGAVKTLQSERAVTVVRPTDAREQLFLAPSADGKGWQETASMVPAAAPPAPTAGPAERKSWLNLGPGWKNQLAIGVMNTSGNDETTTFRGDISLKYNQKPDELTMKLTGVYGVSNGRQNQGLFAQNAVYRRDVTEKLYAFVDDDIRHDAIKGISLQAQTAGGLGYWLHRSDKFKIDVRGGPGMTYLKTFDGREDISPAAEAGMRAQYVFNERMSLSQEATYTTSLTDMDIWRIHAETALNFKLDLERGLGLKVAFNDDYENQPTNGRKNNDTRLSLALTLDF